MRVMTILGTRPELIKMSEIIKKLDKYTDHIFVHTGQNYDYELNEIFYKDLGLRKPDHFLDCAKDSLAATVASVLVETEKVLQKEKPDAVIILGDTNSAIAGYVVKRMKIPLFHLEAGNRCFDDNVPEEINRRILDHIADVNMVYTENQRNYLLSEGIAKDRLFIMGSPMKEVIVPRLADIKDSKALETLGLKVGGYYVMSIHRDENLEIKKNMDRLVQAIDHIAKSHNIKIVLSTHPRFMNKIKENNIKFHKNVVVMKPFGFIDYIRLQVGAKCVISDSGTVPEESAVLGFPAVAVRNAFERPEAADVGSIIMSGLDGEDISRAIEVAIQPRKYKIPYDYDVDNCSDRVLRIILGYTNYINKYVWHK